MARRRRRVGGVAVGLAAAVSPWWHARASVSGRCDPSAGDFRYGFDSGCGAPLSIYSARVELVGTLAQVVVNETFTNDAKYPIEDASLALSVPGGATILGFRAEIAGSDVAESQAFHGEVRMRQGMPACPRTSWASVSDVVGSSNPGTMRLTLGRIPPSASLNVRLEYVQELKATLKPRHGSVLKLNLQLPPGSRRKSSQRAPQDGSSVLSVDVAVVDEKSGTETCSSELGIAAGEGSADTCRAANTPRSVNIASSSHGSALKMVTDAGHASAARLRSDTLQDVVIEIGPVAASEVEPQLFLEQHPELGTAVAALWLPPTLAVSSHSNLEVVLILDRSMSMVGTRVDRIRQAAKTFLRSVPADASVNLIGFGADEGPLFKQASQKLSQDTFQSAVDFIASSVETRSSERGVPGARGAFISILKDLTRDGTTQLRVFFVTDRHVPDGDACVREIATHCAAGSCQVSALGLGWGASPQFIENAARTGHGTARFVAERGGVEPLERTLITQLAEALQPAVKDISVEWAAAFAGDHAENAEGAVSLLGRQADKNREALESDLLRFHKQGGVREILTVPVDLPAVAAGDRMLAAAFLGRISKDAVAQQSVLVHATIGGVKSSRKAQIRLLTEGSALHTLCGSRLAEVLERGSSANSELAGADDRDWQMQALGLTYQLTTAHTQWLALPGDVANLVAIGGQSLMLEKSDSVHCSGPRGMSPLSSVGRYGGPSNPNWDLDPVGGIGRSEPQMSAADLSVRRPRASSKAASLSIQTFSRLMPRLSTLDFTELGSSMALRRLPGGNSPWGNSMDFASISSSLSLRTFMYGKMFEGYDALHMGASLSIKNTGKAFGAYDFLDGGDDIYGEYGGRYRDPWTQSLYGSSMAVRSFDRFSGKDVPGKSPPLSLRSHHKCGSKLSVVSSPKLAARFSAVDFTHLGSSLALRKLKQPSGMSPFRYGALSMLDYSRMGSSLSLGGFGFGRRSALSVQGASRFGLDLMGGYGPDGMPGDLSDLRGASSSALSLRSFPRMGKSLAVLDSGEAAASRHARLASQLADSGASDFSSLAASLSLRPMGRAYNRPGAGRHGSPDMERLASSLSLRRLSTGQHPVRYGDLGAAYGGLNDPLGPITAGASAGAASADGQKKISDGMAEDQRPPWDDYLPRYGTGGYLSTRQVGRLGSTLAVIGDGKATKSSATVSRDDKQSRPDAWVGVGIAGSLVAPVLAIWRSGSTCQVSNEEVLLEWPASAAVDGRLGPAAVYAASGPLVENGAVHLAELAIPTQGTVRSSISFRLSHSCVLTARPSPEGGSTSQGGAALFEVSLAKTELPAGAKPTGEALSAALKRRQSVLAGADSGITGQVGPVTVEVKTSNGAAASSPRIGDYHTLTDLQRFDGSFDLSKMSADAIQGLGLQSDLLDLLVAAYSSGTGGGDGRLVAHTATALAVLRARHAAAEESWALIAAKAEVWLAGADGAGNSRDEHAPPRCLGTPELCVTAAELAVVRWATSPLRPSR